MTTTAQAADVQLAPYIFFYGRCEEALEFYKSVFGGSYELMRAGDTPMAEKMPPETHDSIMHATFTAPGLTFMASDGREKKSVDPEDGNVSLALSFTDTAHGKRVFDALCQGGTVEMPLDDAFWGGKFGIANDRFGNQWLVTTP